MRTVRNSCPSTATAIPSSVPNTVDVYADQSLLTLSSALFSSVSDASTRWGWDTANITANATVAHHCTCLSRLAIRELLTDARRARENCRKYQEDRSGNRWKKVEDYSKRMRAGEIPKIGTVFLLADARNETLVPVDGARRLMAFCEARIRKVDVVVIMSMQQN